METRDKKDHAETETRVFRRILGVCFPPTDIARVKGLYPTCSGHLHSLE